MLSLPVCCFGVRRTPATVHCWLKAAVRRTLTPSACAEGSCCGVPGGGLAGRLESPAGPRAAGEGPWGACSQKDRDWNLLVRTSLVPIQFSSPLAPLSVLFPPQRAVSPSTSPTAHAHTRHTHNTHSQHTTHSQALSKQGGCCQGTRGHWVLGGMDRERDRGGPPVLGDCLASSLSGILPPFPARETLPCTLRCRSTQADSTTFCYTQKTAYSRAAPRTLDPCSHKSVCACACVGVHSCMCQCVQTCAECTGVCVCAGVRACVCVCT